MELVTKRDMDDADRLGASLVDTAGHLEGAWSDARHDVAQAIADGRREPVRYPWAIFCRGALLYVGLHTGEADCWQIYLGWPSLEEIEYAKREGKICERVSVQRHAR